MSSTAAAFPIERAGDRVIVVRMTANKANVLTHELFAQLHATLDVIEREYANVGVVLTGNGNMFSAGLNLKFMVDAKQAQRYGDMIDYILQFERLCMRVFTFPRPTVAAIEGHAIAGGTVLAAACDFRISNGKGNFGMNEVINGLTLPFKMAEILRFAAGQQSAKNMFLTGHVFNAKRALALGVVDEIVAPEQLLERAIAVATYTELSMTTYPSIKAQMQRPTLEVIAQNDGFTRQQMERDYGVKAKL